MNTAQQDHLENLYRVVNAIQMLADAEGATIAVTGDLALSLYGAPADPKVVEILSDRMIESVPKEGQISKLGVVTCKVSDCPVLLTVLPERKKYAPLYEEALAGSIRDPGRLVEASVVAPAHLCAIQFGERNTGGSDNVRWLLEHELVEPGEVKILIAKHFGSFGMDDFDCLLETIDLESTPKDPAVRETLKQKEQRLAELKQRLSE